MEIFTYNQVLLVSFFSYLGGVITALILVSLFLVARQIEETVNHMIEIGRNYLAEMKAKRAAERAAENRT